jgi:hypothetical protein
LVFGLNMFQSFWKRPLNGGAKRGLGNRFSEDKVWYPKWMKRLEVFGAILVVAGVSGELYAEAYREALEAKIRDLSNSAVAKSNERAADANKEAIAARKDAAQFGIDLERERQKTARFQKDADVARLALDKQIKTQGPRWLVLRESAPELVKNNSCRLQGNAYFCLYAERDLISRQNGALT